MAQVLDSRAIVGITKDDEFFPTPPIEPEGEWAQPPASMYVFLVEGGILHGQLTSGAYWLSSGSSLIESPPLALAEELEAWERASDEALRNFEAGL